MAKVISRSKKCIREGGRWVGGKCKMPDLASMHAERSKIRTGKKKYSKPPKRSSY